MLGPAGDVGIDPDALELATEDLLHVGDERLPLLALDLDLAHDGVELHALELLEGEVLELPLELPDPKAMRQRREDVHRLAGHPLAAGRGQRRHRAHVVEAVGELDEDDADVLGHGHEHLADVLGLGLLRRGHGDLVELGDPRDQPGDVGTEVPLQVGRGDVGVLDDVMEDCRGQGLTVEAQPGEDVGHLQRVLDVLLA